MDFGLPQGWEGRIVTRQFGGLCLNLPAREDQICFKLYAAVDRGPNDKHFEDSEEAESDRRRAGVRCSMDGDTRPLGRLSAES